MHADKPEPPDASLDLDPAVVAELDRLDGLCRAAPEEIAPQVALWEAVASLERWLFINRGTAEAPRPYAVADPGGAMLCVFSTAERARVAALDGGIVTGDETVPLFSVPLPQAVDWVASFAQAGVLGVVIDHATLGAWTPLANLARLRGLRGSPRDGG